MSALIVAVKHCHSLASARLSQARNHKIYLERKLEAQGLEESEGSGVLPDSDALRVELLALSKEVKVLQRRRKENR